MGAILKMISWMFEYGDYSWFVDGSYGDNFHTGRSVGCQVNLGENPASSYSVRSTGDLCHGTLTEEDTDSSPLTADDLYAVIHAAAWIRVHWRVDNYGKEKISRWGMDRIANCSLSP